MCTDNHSDIEFLKQGAEDISLYQPPAEIWQNIEAEIFPKKSQQPLGHYAIAASILLSTIVFTYQKNDVSTSLILAEQALQIENELSTVPITSLITSKQRWQLINNQTLLLQTRDEQQKIELLEQRLILLNRLLLQSTQTQQFI